MTKLRPCKFAWRASETQSHFAISAECDAPGRRSGRAAGNDGRRRKTAEREADEPGSPRRRRSSKLLRADDSQFGLPELARYPVNRARYRPGRPLPSMRSAMLEVNCRPSVQAASEACRRVVALGLADGPRRVSLRSMIDEEYR